MVCGVGVSGRLKRLVGGWVGGWFLTWEGSEKEEEEEVTDMPNLASTQRSRRALVRLACCVLLLLRQGWHVACGCVWEGCRG